MAALISLELDTNTVEVLRLIGVATNQPEDAVLKAVIVSGVSSAITNISPTQFEHLIGEGLTKRGFDVTRTGGAGDEGLDIVATRGGERLVVQCKRYASEQVVSPREMREFLGAMSAAQATKGIFVTTSSFSVAAADFAGRNQIELVDGSMVLRWLAGVGATPVTPPIPDLTCSTPGCRYVLRQPSRWISLWICPHCKGNNRYVEQLTHD